MLRPWRFSFTDFAIAGDVRGRGEAVLGASVPEPGADPRRPPGLPPCRYTISLNKLLHNLVLTSYYTIQSYQITTQFSQQ